MNEILKLLSDIPILIVLIVFIISIIYTLTQYIKSWEKFKYYNTIYIEFLKKRFKFQIQRT